jgi:enolase
MMGAAGGMIFKPNQAGTITEALEAAEYMTERGMLVIPSGRAGGVADPPEKEIGLAKGMYMVKTGAPRSGPRTTGFNFLCRVGEELSLPVANVREMPFFSHLKPKQK